MSDNWNFERPARNRSAVLQLLIAMGILAAGAIVVGYYLNHPALPPRSDTETSPTRHIVEMLPPTTDPAPTSSQELERYQDADVLIVAFPDQLKIADRCIENPTPDTCKLAKRLFPLKMEKPNPTRDDPSVNCADCN